MIQGASASAAAAAEESGPGWIGHPALFKYAKEIISLAKLLTIFEFPWMPRPAFGKPCPIPALDESPAAKYGSPEAFTAHVTYHLYSVLPPKFHEHLQNMPAFENAVCILSDHIIHTLTF